MTTVTTHTSKSEAMSVSHPSVIMHLKHFTTVTELSLANMTFQSYWEFRRFVVALPALSDLHLDNILLTHSDPIWRHIRRSPSLFSAPQNLTHLSIGSPLSWNPLWIWVTFVQTQHQTPKNPDLHPFLIPHDAETMWNLMPLEYDAVRWHKTTPVKRGGQLWYRFSWSYNENHQQCMCPTSAY